MARPKTIKPVELYPHWPSPEGFAVPANIGSVRLNNWWHAESMRIVVARLRDYIEDQGWSLRRTAETVGVNHVSLHDMLRGYTWPRAEHIAQIELALDIVLWPLPGEVREGLVQHQGVGGSLNDTATQEKESPSHAVST